MNHLKITWKITTTVNTEYSVGGQETIDKDHDSDKSLVGNKNTKKRKNKNKVSAKILDASRCINMPEAKLLEESIVDGSIFRNLRKQHSSISDLETESATCESTRLSLSGGQGTFNGFAQ